MLKEPEEEEREPVEPLWIEGEGSNWPDRVFVMGNRDFNLGVANHADKWAVFWIFTLCTSFVPYCLQKRKGSAFKSMVSRKPFPHPHKHITGNKAIAGEKAS